MNISGFFDVKKHNIGGVMLTLNSLENDFMRPSYLDARLHFVLVCGAIGCPPIINQENQLYAYSAVFETLYNENWFAGGFLWKWFAYPNSGGPTNDRFTPQNKLAEEKLRSFFKKSVNQ